MKNNTRANRKPKGQHQKRVKQAIIESFFSEPYHGAYHIGSKGYAYMQNATIKVIWGTNNSGRLIRVI